MPRTFVWHPGRGPAKTPAQDLPETGSVQIKQVRSEIGHSWRMRRTLEAIGLKHHQDVVVKEITPGLKGQLKQVRHLVEVSTVGAEKPAKKVAKSGAKAATKKETK